MYSIWRATIDPIKRLVPETIRKRKLNFIAIHYIYVIFMALLGSILVYAQGELSYIDSLFFASGATTQSGLNTVDVNLIHTGQQVVLYIWAMLCNPIIIHSFVVFIRLYWFEKRFQHIVRDAKNLRRTKSRSRTNTFTKDESHDVAREEMGVRGRAIRVLHNTQRKLGRPGTRAQDDKAAGSTKLGQDGDSSDNLEKPEPPTPVGVRVSEDNVRLPQQMSAEQHIAFLENQRNPKDDTTLRIPSPREFDRGGMPEAVDEDRRNGITRQDSGPVEGSGVQNLDRAVHVTHEGEQIKTHITIDEPSILRSRTRTGTFPGSTSRGDDGADPAQRMLSNRSQRRQTFAELIRSHTTKEKEIDPMPYLSYEATIGRNSMFVNLTEEQREELGGIEYRSLKTLALILSCYFLGFHLLGVVSLVPWIRDVRYGRVVKEAGQGRAWWGVFTSGSAFNDLGFTLTPDSMISFNTAVFPLLLMTFLIIIGNTGFPCMLRFIIWFMAKIVPRGSGLWEELRFLLDHPRRCFTLLFPRNATWWLFAILVALNGLDLIFFIILDLNDSTVTSIPPGLRFVDGLFQASSTRTAGFSVVNLADLHPAIQVSYLIMMYISVFPIAISMRRTNVYEEKSLGIYGNVEDESPDADANKEPSYVGAHLRRQLSFDLWYIFLGMFIIAIVEGTRLENTNEYAFTLFSVLFEIVSAYGTVGLSLGYPGANASFSGQFKTISKLVIIAMQIRGRHRGLPYQLDRAILLPSEGLHSTEAIEAERRHRRGSNLSNMSAVTGQHDLNRPFRAETGLTTSSSAPHHQTPSSPVQSQWLNGQGPSSTVAWQQQTPPSGQARDRRGTASTHASSLHTVPTHNTTGSHSHSHGPRKELGNVMFHLAPHPEVQYPGDSGSDNGQKGKGGRKRD